MTGAGEVPADAGGNSEARELSPRTLLVFVSDSHIGGDEGCDGFESPDELKGLFEELARHDGPVELVLAGDFFDLLQISHAPPGSDRAALTMDRPEYREMFGALRQFASGEGNRVTYMPGNHDAEIWWNPRVQKTLLEGGLVDTFALSYLACFDSPEGEFTVYCEHGNQFDPVNTIEDYADSLDTPVGHHIVTDFTRRVAPLGEVVRNLDLAEIKNVYPLSTIPQWVASKYFYGILGRVFAYLMVPFIVIYALYRAVALYLDVTGGLSLPLSRSYRVLPDIHAAFIDLGFFLLISLALFAALLLLLRLGARRLVATLYARSHSADRDHSQQHAIEAAVREVGPMPMLAGKPPPVDAFISGHTHRPDLGELQRPDGSRAVVVNSGCWLRQLSPVGSWLRWPPVFASHFVLTHVRVFMRGSALRVELWEHPKPADASLMLPERLASWRRRPDQPIPEATPRIASAAEMTRPAHSGTEDRLL